MEPDIEALPFVILVLAVAIILMTGIDRLLAWFNIRPAEPPAGGFADVMRAVRGWLATRRR